MVLSTKLSDPNPTEATFACLFLSASVLATGRIDVEVGDAVDLPQSHTSYVGRLSRKLKAFDDVFPLEAIYRVPIITYLRKTARGKA